MVLGLEVRVRKAEKHFLQLVSLEEVRKKLILVGVFSGTERKNTEIRIEPDQVSEGDNGARE